MKDDYKKAQKENKKRLRMGSLMDGRVVLKTKGGKTTAFKYVRQENGTIVKVAA